MNNQYQYDPVKEAVKLPTAAAATVKGIRTITPQNSPSGATAATGGVDAQTVGKKKKRPLVVFPSAQRVQEVNTPIPLNKLPINKPYFITDVTLVDRINGETGIPYKSMELTMRGEEPFSSQRVLATDLLRRRLQEEKVETDRDIYNYFVWFAGEKRTKQGRTCFTFNIEKVEKE